MIKRFLFILCVLLVGSSVFADTGSDSDYIKTHTEDLLNKIKLHRESIYEKLELTSEQAFQINELDKKCYTKLEPQLIKLSVMTKKIEDIANSDNCTKKAVYAVKKEFKSVEKDMNLIKMEYNKEFKSILSSKQKSKYRVARAKKRLEYKQEMKNQIELQKSKN